MPGISTGYPNKKSIQIGDFTFAVESDHHADPLTGVEVWVWFRGEPCCDDNGHQHRFFLPLGVKDSTIDDFCNAFTLASHCETISFAA